MLPRNRKRIETLKNQQLSSSTLDPLIEATDISTLSFDEILNFFNQDQNLSRNAPEQAASFDPRTLEPVLYNNSRSRRPRDNQKEQAANKKKESKTPPLQEKCAICAGKTTGVLDVAPLSEGFTFINKNLFPMIFPFGSHQKNWNTASTSSTSVPKTRPTFGLHLVQWTSSLHDQDWHNMSHSDCVIAMTRLQLLEGHLLRSSQASLPTTESSEPEANYTGTVSIIKNGGRSGGASMAHGHQQISFSNLTPVRMRENQRFLDEQGEVLTQYLLRENPHELLVADYGSAVLLVPYFMRRPYYMSLIVRDTSKNYLHQLSVAEIDAICLGWQDAIRAIHRLLPLMGREIAYNIIAHNGPGAGVAFDFLPFTQETGGFEHLGLAVSQSTPETAADQIRQVLRD
jgi:galactose-1-phosphate uridylyltransferase